LLGVSFLGFAQVPKDSLYGYFRGTRIITEMVNGGYDTISNSESIAFVTEHESDCKVSYHVDSSFLGRRFLSTYDMLLCDRELYEVNKDSLINSEVQGVIYFFGKDSILELVSLYDQNWVKRTNEFRGVRDPNYQSISPPLTQVDLKVFPNPATNQVTIQFPEPGTLKVFNMLGQVQVQLPFSGEQELNVEHWSEGVYIVELEVEETKIRQRVVVQ